MKDRNWRNGEPGLVRNAWALGGLNQVDWPGSKSKPTPSRSEGAQGDLASSKQCPPRPLEPWEERKRHVLGASTLTPLPDEIWVLPCGADLFELESLMGKSVFV